MKPYYEDEAVTIYHGDCREVLPSLAAESVHIILTSPPYNVGLNYAGYDDNMPADEFAALMRFWLGETHRIAVDTARCYAVLSDRLIWDVRPMAESAGWTYGQMLAWCKPNLVGGTGRFTGDWNQLAEWILQFRKGKKTPMESDSEGTTFNWFVEASPQSTWIENRKQHPAQWPIRLARRILGRTPGEVVLDPFMGSGTGIRAARDLGKRAIGIDVSEESCELAAKRMAQGVLL